MSGFKADLHCHSTSSDGSLTPAELIALAHQIGLKGLSITDHDTISAYETAFPLAEKFGIELLPGIEFSAHYNRTSVHILGYAFTPSHPSILSLCERHVQRRKERNEGILTRLKEIGIPLEYNDIVEDTNAVHTIGRPHIAKALVKKGYVDSIQNAFKRYLAEGKPGYVTGSFINVNETLQVIHEAQGIAIIAHPHLIEKPETAQALLEMPFDGIECYYGNLSADQNQRWIKIADKKGWIKTGGSDFHGSVKPMIPLGCSFVGEETFKFLYQHYLNLR